MKRKLLVAVLAALLAMTMVVPCSAVEAPTPDLLPCATSVAPSLTFIGNTAHCYISIEYPGKSICARIELWQGDTLLTSWSDSAVSTLVIDEEYPVVFKRTYTLKVVGTAGGNPISAVPCSAICP